MDKRKKWEYRGCLIEPQTGPSRYFGHPNYTPGCRLSLYRTKWWRITFPDNTWVLSSTKEQVITYINHPVNRHRFVQNKAI